MYPISVVVVAFVVVAVIMIFVIPAFKSVFSSFGADLPAPTLFVIAMSEFFVAYWWLIFGGVGGGLYFFFQAWKRNEKMQKFMARNGWPREAVEKIIAGQASRAQRLSAADLCLHNDGLPLEALDTEVRQLAARFGL